MFFQRSTWPWLYMTVGVILGHKQSKSEQDGKSQCFQFNRVHCSFEEAKAYCHKQGGRLAQAWKQEIKAVIQSSLEEGSWWWVEQNPKQRKHQGTSHPGNGIPWGVSKYGKCTSVFKSSEDMSSKQDQCAQKHYFICQAGDPSVPKDPSSSKKNKHTSHSKEKHKKTKSKVKDKKKMASGDTHPSNLCHPVPDNHFNIMCNSNHPSSIPPQTTTVTPVTQVTSVIPVSRNPSQVTLVTTIPRRPSQVTSFTPASSSPPQLMSVTPASRNPSQVTLVTPVSRNPSQVTLVTTIPSSPPQVMSITPASSSPPQVTSVTPASSSPPQVTSVTPAASSPPQVTSVTPASSSPPQVTSVTPAASSPPQVTSVTPASSSPPQVMSVTPAASSPPQVMLVTPVSRNPSQVTLVTTIPSSPSQVTSVTPASSSPPQVTSVTPAASSPPQVTLVTPVSRNPSQVTLVTTIPSSPPQVMCITPASSSPPQVTSVTPASSSPPQVTSVTPAASSPPQVKSVTPASSSPPQVTSVTPASSSPPQVMSVTPAASSPPQVMSVTPAASSPPQVMLVTPVSRNPSQVTLVTTIPSSPSQVTSVTPAASSPPQVTLVTPAASSPPQVTLVTPVSRNPSQVTLVTTIPSSPPQVMSITPAASSPPQVTSVTPASSSPPQVTSVTPASSSPPQVTSVTPAASSPPQVTSVTPAASSPPQVTSVTPASSSPPQVMLVTPVSRNPSQVTLVTTIPSSPSQVTSVTPAASSPPQVTSVTPAASSPPQVTLVPPVSRNPSQVTLVTTIPSSPPQVMSITPASSSPPQVTSVTPAASSPPQVMSVTPAASSPPQVTLVTPAASSPPQVTLVTPVSRNPSQVTLVTTIPSSPPQVTSVTPTSSSPPQVTSVTPAASSPPQVTSVTPAASSPPQEMSDLPAPNSLPQSVITEPTRPVSAAPAGRPLVDITSRSKEDSHPSVITTHPQASFQNASNQVLNETAGKFGGAIPGLQAHSRLKKACDILQKRRHFTPTFPAPDQVSVIDLLTDLSDQLLMLVPLQENSSWSSKTPARICLFSPLNSEAQGKKESQQPKQDTEKLEDMLETSLMALGEIQEAFLQQSPFAESSVTLTSSVATLVFSSQNISTLPLSSYTLGDPAPVRLGFPSAAALKALWNNHLGINVQVTGLAFNPFKTLDNRSIAGSVGSVLLSSGHETLQVHDLMEDVEIMLWRNSSMEIHPTTFRTSTDRFIITMNVTSLEKSLIVTIDPESPLLMTLYLGFQYQPDHTHFHLNITLPKDHVWQKDEEYTWVLTPESLQYGIGTYYITAMVNKRMEATLQTPVLVSVVTGITQCYFWDKYNRTWNSNGCQVGSQSTVWKTQCLCNHLTFFSSDFFIVPRTVDIEDTVKLFLHVTNNPVGVSLLASLVGFYMILVVWAWRKDQLDMKKVKVTVLADNDPSAQFHYLIQVYTGYRRRAATTAKVVITLYGSEGRSDPHHLCDPQKTVFERGALDVFLLTTESSLGELHGLRLWHDNSGSSPSWFVSQVVVSDMALKRKWHFLCNCWLAEDLGDCEHDGVFMPATKRDLLSFRHLFSSMIIEKFTQDYLWLSVATRHPWNQLTRVKRLTCCMTLLLCDMVINVMFWKMGGTAAKRDEQSPFTVTWSELLISIQTTVILLPVHLVIERLFLLIQPQEALPPLPPMQASCPSSAAGEPPSLTVVVEELKETVGFLLRRNIRLLSECDLSLWSSCNINKLVKLLSSLIYSHLEDQGRYQQAESHWANVVSETHHHFCCYLLKVLLRLKSHLGTLGLGQVHQPCNFSEAASQLQKLQELLETQILPREQRPCRNTTSFPILSPEEGKQPISTRLLRWLTYISWLLLSVISLASAFFTALYSLELNKDQAASWVISMILSVLQDIFISQPVKVTFFTFLFSLMVSWMPWLHKDKEQQTKKIVALWAKCSSSLPGLRDKNNPIYTAPTMSSPAKRPKKAWTKKKLFKLTGDILVQIIFLILLMTAVYSAKNSNKFFLHQAIWKSFSRSFSDIKLLEDFYPWANQTLLPNLYGDYRGFITDGNNFLLGNVLLRQIRITNATFFPVSFQNPVKPYYHHQEDMKNYRVGWGPPDTNSTKSDSIWHYQNQESLGGNPIQGEFATYSGGGYVVRLGRTSSTATRILQHLEQMHWLDHCTKALFVEFVVFNANVNLFCVVTLILESNNVGAFFPSLKVDSLTSLQVSEKGFAWTVSSQVIYYLLVCYYTFVQGCRLKRQKWKFLTRRRNILDTSIILISFSILGLDMKRISLHHKNMMQYHLDQDRFISFHETLKVSSAVTHLMGFLVLLATVQLWDLLRHNPRFQVINKTLSKAWDEVMGFLLIILILLTSYAMTFNLLFGWSISDYQSFFSSAVNVIGLLMGISPHKEVIALYPVLGPLLILTSVILMGLMIINLFISAILIAFGKERKSLKKEAALTDMLLQKLSDLLGIQQHKNQPSPEKWP